MSYAAQVRSMNAHERFQLVNALLAISIQRHGPLLLTPAEICLELMGGHDEKLFVRDLPDGSFSVEVRPL